MQLLEIEAQRPLALQGERLARDIRGDVGIAVAVAADPAAHAQEGRHVDVPPGRLDAPEPVLEIGIEDRQRAQERVVVIGEPVGDFVDHPEAGVAQDAGLPQSQHGATQRLAIGPQLLRRELDPVALVEQPRNLHFAIDRTLAPDLGWMRRQHGTAKRAREEGLQPLAGNTGLRGAAERIGHRALRRRHLGDGEGPRAADVVLVLGDVGQMREVTEGADDAKGAIHRQAAHGGLQFLPRRLVGVTMEQHPGAADVLDQVEHGVTFLVAHRLAEDAPEKPRVVAQRHVLLGRFPIGRFDLVHGLPPSPLS